MGKGIEIESSFQDKLRRLWSNLIKWGIDNQEEFLFVGQFCSSPYTTKFTREEVMKEYVFLHNLVNEGIKTGEIKDFSPELTIAMFYQGSRAVVSLILDSNMDLDTDELVEKGFQIIWNGLKMISLKMISLKMISLKMISLKMISLKNNSFRCPLSD